MRVISGIAKGRKLKTPAGERTRPTADRVKEAVFSILQFEIEGRRVIDLFAGSGQMGIEALSRGAESAVFVENDGKAAELILSNLRVCGFEKLAEVKRGDAFSQLESLSSKSVDIVFADPPYQSLVYSKILEKVSEFDILRRNGIILFESPVETEFPEVAGTLRKAREYRYGKVKITLFRNE